MKRGGVFHLATPFAAVVAAPGENLGKWCPVMPAPDSERFDRSDIVSQLKDHRLTARAGATHPTSRFSW